jgi:hypothetical protein
MESTALPKAQHANCVSPNPAGIAIRIMGWWHPEWHNSCCAPMMVSISNSTNSFRGTSEEE